MPKFKWSITRKSDSKVTHMVFSEIQPPLHPDWGSPATFDIVKGEDVELVMDYQQKLARREADLQKSILELLEAILSALKDSQDPKLQAAIAKFEKIKSDNPIPNKPGGVE